MFTFIDASDVFSLNYIVSFNVIFLCSLYLLGFSGGSFCLCFCLFCSLHLSLSFIHSHSCMLIVLLSHSVFKKLFFTFRTFSVYVSYVYMYTVLCLVSQLCPTLCSPMYCSMPGSHVHATFQARILERVAISYSRASSWPRNQTCVSLHFLCWQSDSLPLHHLGRCLK